MQTAPGSPAIRCAVRTAKPNSSRVEQHAEGDHGPSGIHQLAERPVKQVISLRGLRRPNMVGQGIIRENGRTIGGDIGPDIHERVIDDTTPGHEGQQEIRDHIQPIDCEYRNRERNYNQKEICRIAPHHRHI